MRHYHDIPDGLYLAHAPAFPTASIPDPKGVACAVRIEGGRVVHVDDPDYQWWIGLTAAHVRHNVQMKPGGTLRPMRKTT